MSGKSYSEIGASLGVSKQAAHKLAGAAIASLREALAAMGFSGIDTLGLIKSQSKSGGGIPPKAIQKAFHFPASSGSSPQVDDEVQRELGRGGGGAVYLATPKVGGDPVAVKLMLSRAQAEPRAIEQFKREMQVTAGLQHPNIVRFLDSGSDQGTFFFFISAFQFFNISAFTQKFPYRFDPKRDPIDIILNENPVPIRYRLPGLAREIADVIGKAPCPQPERRVSGCR